MAVFRRDVTDMLGRKLLTVALLFSSSAVCGDEPTVSYIFPAGGQRGTTVEFRVGGHYLHQHARFEMRGEGVTAVEQLTRASNTI